MQRTMIIVGASGFFLLLLLTSLGTARAAGTEPGSLRGTTPLRSATYTLYIEQKAATTCECCMVFADGFESGDTSAWSMTSGFAANGSESASHPVEKNVETTEEQDTGRKR